MKNNKKNITSLRSFKMKEISKSLDEIRYSLIININNTSACPEDSNENIIGLVLTFNKNSGVILGCGRKFNFSIESIITKNIKLKMNNLVIFDIDEEDNKKAINIRLD